jgi:hypothetical protein
MTRRLTPQPRKSLTTDGGRDHYEPGELKPIEIKNEQGLFRTALMNRFGSKPRNIRLVYL